MRSVTWLALCAVLATAGGCDTLFGTKQDNTTEEIFEEGRTPPGFVEEVSYVPLNPYFRQGGGGQTFQAPQDVYVGYDELIYVVDEAGLHVLDRAGRPQTLIDEAAGQSLQNATSVIQDRRLHVYVTARRDTMVNGQNWNLPVVYRYAGLSTGEPYVADIIWHPFDDDSRKFNPRFQDPIATDEEVEFTGVAVLPNTPEKPANTIYVTRRGPVNDIASSVYPHNTVLEFTPTGTNTQAILALDPSTPSLRSAVFPADISTYVQPPQRQSFPATDDFILAQNPPSDEPLRYGVLSIRAVTTSDGIVYQPDSDLLQQSFNTDAGEGFLYSTNFEDPVSLAYAADGTGYIYVLDAGKDSLFTFTSNGIEGVSPPPGASTTQPVPVSFGGSGDGAMQFNAPQGVTYFDEIVYVADTGNNRIARFKLNTDFE